MYTARSWPWTLAIVGMLLISSLSQRCDAETIQVQSAQEFRQKMQNAKPGDKLVLAAGIYQGGFYFRAVHGTAIAPIVIQGADEQNPPQFSHDADPLHLSQCSYIELQNLRIVKSGANGINIDDGGKPNQPSHHIRLVNITVSDTGPSGNLDAIKISGVQDFKIEQCSLASWGSGGTGIDMVGCQRGEIIDCSFSEGGASAVQAKGGCADIVIRKCRFRDYGLRGVNIGGSTGDAFFRPSLDSFPHDERYEAKNITVEGCVFIGGSSPIAFVGVDGALVRYNTIYRPDRQPVRILREKNDTGFVLTRNGRFENNIVIVSAAQWPGNLLNIGPGTAPETFSFSKNLWFCDNTTDRRLPKLPIEDRDSLFGVDPQFLDSSNLDLNVQADSPALDRGAHALPPDAAE